MSPADDLLLESGSLLILEDGTGNLVLESSSSAFNLVGYHIGVTAPAAYRYGAVVGARYAVGVPAAAASAGPVRSPYTATGVRGVSQP